MAVPTCTRSFGIDIAHRVLKHESKCKHLHGHRLLIEVTCQAKELDPIGRVIDFGQVKAIVGGWLDSHLDHNIILNSEDPLLDLRSEDLGNVLGGRVPHIMDCNPTSENLAMMIYRQTNDLLMDHGIRCIHVRVYETPNCWADYEEVQ